MNRALRFTLLGLAVVVVLFAVAFTGCGGSETAGDLPCEPVTTRGVGAVQEGILLAADASSPTDVWAVGASNNLSPKSLGLALRWDGDRWVRVDVAGVEAVYDVTVVGPRDAWALGPRVGDGYWLGHWDGTGWSEAQPPPGWKRATFMPNAIDGVAADDVWLVGTDFRGPAPYIVHWDGERWSLSEVNSKRGLLEDISAFSADSVWAAGYASWNNEYGEPIGHIVLRWDGKEWLEISTPEEIYALDNITATGRDEAWVVPNYVIGEPAPLWRWDGRTWTHETSPLFAISALSSLDGVLWAAGSKASSVAIARLRDGEWEQASMAGARSLDAEDPFPGFVAVSETTAWGVGREPVVSRACVG